MEPIRASYQESEEFYLQATEQIPQRRPDRVWLTLVAIVLVLLSLQLCLTGDKLWFLPALFGGGFIFLFTSKRLRRRLLRSSYRKARGNKDVFVNWEFDEQGLCCKSGYDAATRYTWNWPKKITQKPGGFLIHVPNKLFYWLPKTAFSAPQDVERLTELMKSKVQDYEVKDGG